MKDINERIFVIEMASFYDNSINSYLSKSLESYH